MRLQLLLATILSVFSLCVLAAPMANPADATVDAAIGNRGVVPPVTEIVYSVKITEVESILVDSVGNYIGEVLYNPLTGEVTVIGTAGALVGSIIFLGPETAIFNGLTGVIAIILKSLTDIVAELTKTGHVV